MTSKNIITGSTIAGLAGAALFFHGIFRNEPSKTQIELGLNPEIVLGGLLIGLAGIALFEFFIFGKKASKASANHAQSHSFKA